MCFTEEEGKESSAKAVADSVSNPVVCEWRAALRRRREGVAIGEAVACYRWVESSLPERKRPAHFPLAEQFNRSDIVLVTICTHQRRPLLARDAAVERMVDAWRKAEGWRVGRYVMLPDHVHFFCAPWGRDAPALARWVKYWKALVSFSWPWPAEKPIWQQGFWDRQLRNGEHYSARWDYVRNNPVRHGLAKTPEEWQWQGEIEEFRFHDPV